MAIIDEVEWLDRDSGEAQVRLRSRNGLFVDCYAFLFDGEVGDMVDCVLSTLDAENAVKVNSRKSSAVKVCDPFRYRITARIVDVKNAVIQLDDLLIDVGYALYGDAEIDDYIAIDISRFDLIRF